MRLLWLVVIAVLCIPTHAFADAVKVRSNKRIYGEGGEVAIRVVNKGKSSVYLPGCDAVVLELFEQGTGFTPLPPKNCDAEGQVIEIKAGEKKKFAIWPGMEGVNYLRPVVTFGVGCRSGLPLDQAECKSIRFVRGRYFGYQVSVR